MTIRVGDTPLIYIEELKIYAKLERNNPTGSVKDRPAYFMIRGAEIEGKLRKGEVIVEPTSGNTGIALAWIGAQRGYKVIFTMPENMTISRVKIMEYFGAEVVLTPQEEGMKGAVKKAQEIVEKLNAFMPNQFDNPYNPLSHELTTGSEILRQMEFTIDAFVAGVGTGGTITGVGRILRRFFKNKVKIIAVEPAYSPVLSGGEPGKHKIPGIGAGFIPKNYDPSLVDEILKVSDEEAFDMMKFLSKKGYYVGVSAAANAFAAMNIRRKYNLERVVTVFPDDAGKYV